jgi:hypothetical protein
MLEHAVRWVIITIIFVFDPLAVLLLLASQYSYEYHRREQKLAAIDDKVIDTDKVAEPPTSEIVSVVEPQEAPSPTIFDQYVLTEINKTLSQELEEQKEITDTWQAKFIKYSKLYDDERQEKAVLLTEIERLKLIESELATAQSERDRLSAAYGHEMDRAETLATLLVQEQSRVVPEVEVAVSEPEPVEPAPPQPVEITADSNINIVSVDSIQTIGVTKEAELYHPSEEYIKYKGKFMSMDALRSMRPDLILKATDPVNRIMFGNKFPDFAKSGDLYIRTDVLPNTVYKFNDSNWIVIDKAHSTTYLQYTPYVQYLIQKIESGEYDTDLLTDDERDEIERHLSTK